MESTNQSKTRSLAKNFIRDVKGGFVIFLVGDLGAGKTQFAKGLAEGLGIDEEIVSPTFVLMNQYQGTELNLVHIDLYRIDNYRELNFEIEDFINPINIVVIEWADKFIDDLPSPDYIINLSYGEKESIRIIDINKIK